MWIIRSRFSSSESYWTLSVSGLLQAGNESTSFSQLAPCFYHEWIYLRFLARVDEDAVLSDSAHSGVTAADAVVPVALHRPWVRLDSEALVRLSSEIRQNLFWWWAHEWLELVSLLRRMSPQFGLWSDSSNVGWALVSPFSGFRVDPQPISVSAASVKVAGVNRPVCNHTFFTVACLIFLFSTIPTLFGQRFFSNHGMGGRRMLFLPMLCFLRFCKKLCSSSGGPRVLGFPELLDLVVDDSVALPLDRDLLSQPQVQ